MDANGKLKENRSKKVLYRSDNSETLGVVSPKYKVVQPDEILQFFKGVCEKFGWEMDTAGTMLGGKRPKTLL